jgi:hypothetical protein
MTLLVIAAVITVVGGAWVKVRRGRKAQAQPAR